MKRALVTWWGHVRVLTVETLRTWWRCLPAAITGLGLGTVGYHSLLVCSAFISEKHPWIAVGLLSVALACLLVGYLFVLRSIGRELAIGDALLRTDQGESLVDEPLSRLVALTLLPFIGIYAVFDKIQETSAQLVTYEVITRGLFSRGVLHTLNPRTTRQMWIILAVLLVAFVVRRTLDHLLERTGRRIFGLLTGLVETFFTLVLIYGGTRMLNSFKDWLHERRVAGWLRDYLDWAADLLSRINVRLPEWIGTFWDTLLGPVWEYFSLGLAQPLLWLAIAALAFGSRVMSASELWRETVAGRPTPLPLQKVNPLQHINTERFTRPGVQKVWVEMKELFFGDLDDKYLPTLQSLRLVLSAGVSLIGAFCLLHAVASHAVWGSGWLMEELVGPRESRMWVALGLGHDLFSTLVGEPLRLSLLGVAYLRCLHLLAARNREVPR